MLDLHWDVHELAERPPAAERDDPPSTTSLVAAVVESDAPTARRVRVRSRFEGPVLPPRRRSVPEAGWCEDGFVGVVPAGGRLALGFAAGGPAVDPPVVLDDRGRAREDAERAREDDVEEGPSPAELLRELGSPAPPRDAVPASGEDAAAGAACEEPVARPSPGEDATAGSTPADGNDDRRAP